MENTFEKQTVALRYWLLGRGHNKAVKAMEFAQRYHTGTRKDGVTPEFSHQIAITQYLRTLDSGLSFPEETYCASFLHDVPEDYNIPISVIVTEFGIEVGDAVDKLTKVFEGVRKGKEFYYSELAKDAIASVCKGGDRIHNYSSMPTVFTPQHQRAYIKEGEDFILPMIKEARRRFPEQEPVCTRTSS